LLRDKRGLFLFFYTCAIWLLCLNPVLAHHWMDNIFAADYFRLVYLLPIPLLCGMLPVGIQGIVGAYDSRIAARLISLFAMAATIVVFFYTSGRWSISPRSPQAAWKSPRDYQLLKENVDFAVAAGPFIARSKLLAPGWTASCELPLLFPKMKVVAPRLVTHYFANAGNPGEGALRHNAQAFVEGAKTNNLRQMAALPASFRGVVKTGRANAVAAPEAESERVLRMLRSINPGWHEELKAGGLVLMLPPGAGSNTPK